MRQLPSCAAPGWRIRWDTGKLHGRDAVDVSRFALLQIAELQVEARASRAPLRPLHSRSCSASLSSTARYHAVPWRYRLLLEQLPVLQHIDFIDVHTIDRVDCSGAFLLSSGRLGRPTATAPL